MQGRLHPAVTDENPDIEIDIEIKVLLLPGRWSAQKPALVHSGEFTGFPRVQFLGIVLPNRKPRERRKIEFPVAFEVMDFSEEMEVRLQNYMRRYVADSLEGATVQNIVDDHTHRDLALHKGSAMNGSPNRALFEVWGHSSKQVARDQCHLP